MSQDMDEKEIGVWSQTYEGRRRIWDAYWAVMEARDNAVELAARLERDTEDLNKTNTDLTARVAELRSELADANTYGVGIEAQLRLVENHALDLAIELSRARSCADEPPGADEQPAQLATTTRPATATKRRLVEYSVPKFVERSGSATMDVPVDKLGPGGEIDLDWVRMHFPDDSLEISDEDIMDSSKGMGEEWAHAQEDPDDSEGVCSP